VTFCRHPPNRHDPAVFSLISPRQIVGTKFAAHEIVGMVRIDSAPDRAKLAQCKRRTEMTRLIALLLLGAFAFAVVGCEAHAKVDDNGAKAGVNVDK
jgi:hypothetical protein